MITIEITNEQRGKLLELAAARGQKGFSALVREAIDRYLAEEEAESRRRRAEAAVAVLGALPHDAADEIETCRIELAERVEGGPQGGGRRGEGGARLAERLPLTDVRPVATPRGQPVAHVVRRVVPGRADGLDETVEGLPVAARLCVDHLPDPVDGPECVVGDTAEAPEPASPGALGTTSARRALRSPRSGRGSRSRLPSSSPTTGS